jgi:hypothetical protein
MELRHKMKHTALQKYIKSVIYVTYIQLRLHKEIPWMLSMIAFNTSILPAVPFPSSPDGLSASLNHLLLFKVTAANIRVNRMARRMEYREVCVSRKCNSFRECQRNPSYGTSSVASK